MRRQAERWGSELYQEDVEFVDVKNRPFTVQSSERKVMLPLSGNIVSLHNTLTVPLSLTLIPS